MLLAQAYYEQGKPDSGLRALNDGKPSSQDRASFEALKAAGYEQQKKYAEAAERYQAAAGIADDRIGATARCPAAGMPAQPSREA